MKRIILSMLAIVTLSGVALASSYSLVRLPAPGTHTPLVGGVGKVVQIEVVGSAVAEGTVTLHTQVPGATSSNLQYTVTCSSGAAVASLGTTNTFFIAAGDTIYRGGTATNGLVRVILQ